MFLSLHRATAYQWALASMLVSCLAAIVSLAAVTILFGWPAFSLRLMLRGIPEGFGYSFGQSAATVCNDIDKTMLSHYAMNQANGIYALAYRVIDMATIPVIAVRDAAVPKLFRIGETDLQATRRLTFRLLTRCVAFSLLFAVVIYVTAPLIPWIVGRSFAESALAVRWLCLIPVLRSLHHTSGSAIMGMGKYHYRLTNQIVTAACNFSLNLWLIPAFGWRGAAWASLFADGMLGLLNILVLLILTRPAGPTSSPVDFQPVE
jgi:O-antigen/teichoic acid export membrane protein